MISSVRFPEKLHLHGECFLPAEYRLHERLRQLLRVVQRLSGQEGLPQPSGRGDVRRQRPVRPEYGLLAHDRFGIYPEFDQQRDRTLLYRAVRLQPAQFTDTEIKIISAYHANNTQAVIKQMICLSPAFRNQLRGVADVKFFMFRPAMLYA